MIQTNIISVPVRVLKVVDAGWGGAVVGVHKPEHSLMCHSLHLIAEPQQQQRARGFYHRINLGAEQYGVVDAVGHYRCQQYADGGVSRMVDEAVNREVIAHEYGKGVMARYGKDAS